MIRPTRLSIAAGGEHLLPVAKHALLMLRTQMERMKVKTLSRIIPVGDGRIEIVANDFGIDSINIVWAGVPPHGIMCWPASGTVAGNVGDASYGWGKPFTDADGKPINPPLGTILQNSDYSKNQKREVLFHKNWKDKDEAHTDLLLKRRLKKQNPEDMGRNSKWISKERGIVLITDGDVIYNRLVVVATTPDDETIKVAGVFTGKDDEGKDKRYFWIVTIYRLITDPEYGLADTVFRSYRAPYRKGSMPKDEQTGEPKKTKWELLGEYNFTQDHLFQDKPNYEIQIGRVVLNESCSEAMILYNDRDFVGQPFVVGDGYVVKPDISGYIVLPRETFTPEKFKNADTMSVSSSGSGETYAEAHLLDVPESFVFDIGYRGDNRVLAELVNADARYEGRSDANRTDPVYTYPTDSTSFNPDQVLGYYLINGTKSFHVERRIDLRIGDYVLPLERTVHHSEGSIDFNGHQGSDGGGYRAPWAQRSKSYIETLSFMRRQILYCNPTDGTILYSELSFEGTGGRTGHTENAPFGAFDPNPVMNLERLWPVTSRGIDTSETIINRNVVVIDGVEHDLHDPVSHNWNRNGLIEGLGAPTPNDRGGEDIWNQFFKADAETLQAIFSPGPYAPSDKFDLHNQTTLALNELFGHIDTGDLFGCPAFTFVDYLGNAGPNSRYPQAIYDMIHGDPYYYKTSPNTVGGWPGSTYGYGTFLPYFFPVNSWRPYDQHRTRGGFTPAADIGYYTPPEEKYRRVRFDIPTYLYPTPGILPDTSPRYDEAYPLPMFGRYDPDEDMLTGRERQIQIPDYAYFPITDERGAHLFSIKADENRWLSSNPYNWVNYLTENDPVILSEITGEQPRFNNITVF